MADDDADRMARRQGPAARFPTRRSAEWCLKGVDRCRSQKQRFTRAKEMGDAKAAYDHARTAYRRIVDECDAD